MHKYIPGVSFCVFAALTGGAYAQSFDCARARNEAESTICEHAPLREMDADMARLYFKVINTPEYKHDNGFRQSQRDWLQSRNDCGGAKKCLVLLYKYRIQEFREILGQTEPPDLAEPWRPEKRRSTSDDAPRQGVAAVCPQADIARMPATSLAEIQCRCFGECENGSDGDAGEEASGRRFRFYLGRDANGKDYSILPDTEFAICVSRCREERQCVAFSYDDWNHWCYLKNRTPRWLLLEPSSITAVVSTAHPQMSSAPTVMERYRNRTFLEKAYNRSFGKSFESCERECRVGSKCEAFTFVKKRRECRLISRPGVWVKDETCDSGVKRQNAKE